MQTGDWIDYRGESWLVVGQSIRSSLNRAVFLIHRWDGKQLIETWITEGVSQ